MTWTDSLDDLHAAVFDELSDSIAAEYRVTPGGSSVPVRVVINRDVDIIGDHGQVAEQRTTLRLDASEVGKPPSGSTVTVGAELFSVDRLLNHDGHVVEVITR